MNTQPPLPSLPCATGPAGAGGGAAAAGAAVPVNAVPVPARRAGAASGRSAAIDRAYEEYCRRRAAGEAVDPDEFCERFPDVRTSLRRLVGAFLWFEEESRLRAKRKPVEWPSTGGTFLGFELLRELGRGSFARVFLASEKALGGRQVVVKISNLGGRVEAQALGRLGQANVVPVHSVQHDPLTGLTVVCMPYLGSATLCDVLDYVYAGPGGRQWAVSILRAIRSAATDETAAPATEEAAAVLRHGTYVDGVLHLAVQLADALAFIHAGGVCHGDLKPSNVLLTPDGRPMLLDFNLSVMAETVKPRVGGTLTYMSPEQLRAMTTPRGRPAPRIDARSDLFALGVILYELLSGRHPFGPFALKLTADELRELLEERLPNGCRPLRQVNPRLDKALARLVESCLAHEPDARPTSADLLATALRQHLSPARRAYRWVSARFLLTTGTLALGLLAGLAASSFFVPKEPYSDHHLRLGEAALRQGNYTEAVGHFDKALEARPDLARAYFLRGRAYQQQDRFDAALANYEQADQLAPVGELKACLGYCANWVKDHTTAVAFYEQAIDLGFTPAEVFNNLGYSYLQLGQAETAQKHLLRALQQDQLLRAAHFNLALLDGLRVGKGQGKFIPSAGIEHIETAIRLGEPAADLHYCAGYLYAAAARQDESKVVTALDHLERAIVLGCEPQNLKALAQFEALARVPRFRDLVKRPFASHPASSTPRLLDPVPDALSR